MHLAAVLTIITSAFLLLCSCEEAEDVYDRSHRVLFRYDSVASKQPLRSALQSPGIYCMITATSRQFVFTNNYGQSVTDNFVALQGSNPYRWSCGLIVGHFDVPTLRGETEVAYSLECPNCCQWDNVERPVQFTDATLSAHTEARVICPRCERVYDLGLEGIIVAGRQDENDIKLRRYPINYDGHNHLEVHN